MKRFPSAARELNTFIDDFFEGLRDDLPESTGYNERINLIIDEIDKRGQMDQLWAALRIVFPTYEDQIASLVSQFDRLGEDLQRIVDATPDAPDPSPEKDRIADTFVVVSDRSNRPPFLRRVCDWSVVQRFSFVIALAIVVAIIPASFTGELSTGTNWSIAADDLRTLVGNQRASISPTQFPLLRDYATMLHVVMIAGLLGLLPAAWARIETVIPALQEAGALRWRSDGGEAESQGWIARSNAQWKSSERATVSLVVALLFAVLGSVGYRRFGVFRIFAPAGDAASWSLSAYFGWWARPLGLPSWGWFALALVGNYLIVWNARVVWSVVLLLWRNSSDYELGIDRSNADSRFGWSVVRALYVHYIKIMSLFGLGLAGFSLIVSEEGVWWLTPFMGLFIFGLVMMSLPLVRYRRVAGAEIARWKADLEVRTRRAEGDEGEIATITAERTRLAAIPLWLVPVPKYAISLVGAVVPAFFFYVGLLRTVV